MKSKISWKLFGSFLIVASWGLIACFFSKSIAISAFASLTIAGLMGFFVARSIVRSLVKMSEVARRISDGDFSKRLYASGRDELGDLARAINVMADSLEKQVTELRGEKGQLKTILDGMVEGVLVTDQEGRIFLVNPALKAMLALDEDYRGKAVLECVRNGTVHDTIEKVLRTKERLEEEITLFSGPGGNEERFVVMDTAPLEFGESGIAGSVAVFYDVTNVRRLENVRKEFVANVSHELKTPLTCIRGYAETLKSGALQDAQAAGRFIDKIESNASQLQNLVEDILRLSAIESGRLEINPQTVALRPVVETLFEAFADIRKTKRITLENRTPGDLKVMADPQAMRQILSNLIENGIKYTQEGGSVTVDARAEDGFHRVSVVDTGIGISERDLPRVFERFYRADKAHSRQMGGTGLGLAIVKHLVQAHGGEVGVSSEVGKGSEFWFTIPAKV